MNYLKRILIYFLGMFLLSAGIVLNSKTNLGVSPIVSVAYCISVITGTNFPNMTMVIYFICFIIEMILKGKRARVADVIQLPFCYLLTRSMNLLMSAIPEPQSMPVRLFLIIPAVLLTGAGVAMMVGMRLVPNPPDGLVQALSDRTGKSLGLCKNFFDASCVVLTMIIGLIAERRIIGIGIGTVAAVLFIGRAVALTNRAIGDFLQKTAEAQPPWA